MISVPVWPSFSALSEVRYDYIKVARDLFIMLRQTPEGRNLFTMLLQLMNRYCGGVIVEGVETLEEWRDVQNSPAAAAQGYFLSSCPHGYHGKGDNHPSDLARFPLSEL